jgi:hypothetical protein
MANRIHDIDPTDDEVRARLRTAFPEHRLPDPASLLEPGDGVYSFPVGDHLVQVARWSDPLGRRHWSFELMHGAAFDYWFEEDQPLAWRVGREEPLSRIAGPLQAAHWGPTGATQVFVVLCHCGLVGTPEQLVWMGTQCGLCHDQELDDDRLRAPETPPADHHLLEVTQGRWISNRIDWPEQTITAYDPFRRRVLWHRRWLTEARFVSGHGLLLVLDEHEATVLDAETGEMQTVVSFPLPLVSAAVLDPQTLAFLHPGSVTQWSLADGGQPLRSWPVSAGRVESLVASPQGDQIALVARDEIRLVDRDGRLKVRLQRPHSQAFRDVAWQASSIFAITPTPQCDWISRWRPDFTLPAYGQMPEEATPCRSWESRFRVAPAGELLVQAERNFLTFHDGTSMRECGTLLFAEGQVDDLAFDDTGRLVVAGGGTLLGMLWREMLGLPVTKQGG